MERIQGRKLEVKLGEDLVGLLNLRLGANRNPYDTQLRRLRKIVLEIIVIEGRRKIIPIPRRMMVMRKWRKVLTPGTIRWMMLRPRRLLEML